MKMKTLVCYLPLLLFGTYVYGQVNDYTFSPRIPSPQTWDFKSYGNVPISIYAGRLDLQIPVYHYQDKDFDIPIGIGYNAVGFSPSKPAGTIGLNWFLNYGGMVTRQVIGVPDDLYYLGHSLGSTGISSGELNGFLVGHRFGFSALTPTSERVFNFLIGQPAKWEDFWAIYASVPGQSKKCETTPDIFSFNFMGYSGKFMLDYDGNIRVWDCYGSDAIQIDVSKVALQRDDSELKPKESEIHITTGNGYVYCFGGNLSSLEYSHNVDNPLSSPWINVQSTTITSWYLSKIIAPNGRTVTFEYMPNAEIPADALSAPYSDKFPEDCYIANIAIGATASFEYEEYNARWLRHRQSNGATEAPFYSANLTKGVFIKEIRIDGGSNIQFGYSLKERPDIYDHRGGMNVFAAKSYKLDNINVYNQHEQLLKTANFSYSYENGNTTHPGDDVRKRLFLRNLSISGIGDYEFDYDLRFQFPLFATYTFDYWGFFKGGPYSSLFPNVQISPLGDIAYGSDFREPSAVYNSLAMLNKITYPTGGYTEIEYELHDYSMRLERRSDNDFWPKLYSIEGNAGGSRVKSLTDIDSESGARHTRTFEYKALGSSQSSGILMNWPRYGVMHSMNLSSSFGSVKTLSFRLDAFGISINSFDNEYITYDAVVEKFDDGSYIEHKFSTYKTNPDDGREAQALLHNGRSNDMCLPYPFWSNVFRNPNDRSIERGKLVSKTVYNAQGHKVSVDSIKYTRGEERFVASTGISGNLFYSRKNYNYSYLPYEEKNYLYGTDPLQPPLEKITQYAYNSLWLEKEKITNQSDGTHLIKRTRYANDVNAPLGTLVEEEKAINAMSRFMKSIPLETTTYIKEKNGQEKFLSAELNMYTRSEFNNTPLPSAQYRSFSSETVNSYIPMSYNSYFLKLITDPNLQKEISYDKYSSSNNLLQYTTRDNTSNSYLWGYNELYPIAHIAGATNEEVEAVLQNNQLIDLNSYRTINQLTPVFEALQTHLPNAHVKGYSYIPQVGISTERGADGINTTYRYDIHGRLLKVLDHNKNVVKQYEYHIKNENDIPNQELNEISYVLEEEEVAMNISRCQTDDDNLHTGYKEWLFIKPSNPQQEIWKVLDNTYTSDCPANYWLEEDWNHGGELGYTAYRSYNDDRKPVAVFIITFYPDEGWGEPVKHKIIEDNLFVNSDRSSMHLMVQMSPGYSVVEKKYILFQPISKDDISAHWTPTGKFKCIEDIWGPTGYLEFEEEDINPYSNTFTDTRWTKDNATPYPDHCEARYHWQDVTTISKLFRIYGRRSYNDGRPTTYAVTINYTNGQNQSVNYTHHLVFPSTADKEYTFELDYRSYLSANISNVNIIHEELPPLPGDPSASWVVIGGSQCAQNDRGNSGYMEYYSKDQNPGSISYNIEKWIVYDPTLKKEECPADYGYSLASNTNNKMVFNAYRSYNDGRHATLVVNVLYTPIGGVSRTDTKTYNFPFPASGTDFTFTLPYSMRANATLQSARVVYERLNETPISVIPGWEGTGVTECEKDSQRRNTGYTKNQEIDTNPHSPEYGQEKWSLSSTLQPSICLADYWSEYLSDSGNQIKIGARRSYNDGRSATFRITVRYSTWSGIAQRVTTDHSFNQGGNSQNFVLDYSAFAIAEVENIEIIYGTYVPNTNPVWMKTGPSQCNKVGGRNTGYIEYYSIDVNPNSTSYNTPNWIVDYDTQDMNNCHASYYMEIRQLDALDGIFEFKRSYNDGRSATYRFTVRVMMEDERGNIIETMDYPFEYRNVFQGSSALSKGESLMFSGGRGTAYIVSSSVIVN